MPSHEGLILPVRELIVPTPDDRRAVLLAELRGTHVELDDRPVPAKWEKSNTWFHSLQDISLAALRANHGLPSNPLRRIQACFVKDLDRYLEGLPEEEAEMKEVFQTIFTAGTSEFWDINPNLPVRLSTPYWQLAYDVIRPWAQT